MSLCACLRIGSWRRRAAGAAFGLMAVPLAAVPGYTQPHAGEAVAITDDTAVVGAPEARAAHIFTRMDDAWTLTATLMPRGEARRFGASATIAGDTVIVGAPVATIDGNFAQGAVFVFTASDGIWRETAKLTASDGVAEDQFGKSVALDGDTLVIGASSPAVTTTGAVYVFTKGDDDVWTETAKLEPSDPESANLFAASVAIAGDTVVAGDSDALVDGTRPGAAYVFTRNGDTWTQTVKLVVPEDAGPSPSFGSSVAVAGQTMLVGATVASFDGDFLGQGAVYVFTEDEGTWTATARLTASDGEANDRFGSSVAIDGDALVVGARQAEVDENIFQGATYVFTRAADGTWTEAAKLTAAEGGPSEALGTSVAIAGDTIVGGAPQARVGGVWRWGAAYVFSNVAGTWMETATLTVPFSRHFSEGATGFFQTEVGLFNPSETEPAELVVRLHPEASDAPVTVPLTLEPRGRETIDVNTAMGDQATGVSIHIESDRQVATTRQVRWGPTLTFGSTLESGVANTAVTWYFAEGATFLTNLFYLLANPNLGDATVTITYLRGSGEPVTEEVVVPAQGRRTIWANAVPGLELTEVSAVISADLPIVAERAMYFGPQFDAGAASRGAAELATRWFFAEGGTSFFDTFLILANLGEQAADVSVRYHLPDGTSLTTTHELAPRSRRTILVDQEDPQLASTTLAMSVSSTEPIVAERAMWWGPTAASWYEGHASLGATGGDTLWAIGEARSGGPDLEDTFVLVANSSDEVGDVQLTLVFDDGTTSQQSFALAGQARLTLRVADHFPEADDRRFSILVENLNSRMRTTVEYARYQSTGGRFGNAGGATLATPIIP